MNIFLTKLKKILNPDNVTKERHICIFIFLFNRDLFFSPQKREKFLKDVMCTCIARDFSSSS